MGSEIKVKSGIVLRRESRVLEGGSEGASSLAHTDCFPAIHTNYWGSKHVFLFDAVALASSQDINELMDRADTGEENYPSVFESLWKLLKLGEDVLFEEDSTKKVAKEADRIAREKVRQQIEDAIKETGTAIHRVTLGPGDAIFIPEMYFHDAQIFDSTFGMSTFYHSNFNMGQTFCEFLKTYHPYHACEGHVSTEKATAAALLTLRGPGAFRNWNADAEALIENKPLTAKSLKKLTDGYGL